MKYLKLRRNRRSYVQVMDTSWDYFVLFSVLVRSLPSVCIFHTSGVSYELEVS